MVSRGNELREVLGWRAGLPKREFDRLKSLEPGVLRKSSNPDWELSGSSPAYSQKLRLNDPPAFSGLSLANWPFDIVIPVSHRTVSHNTNVKYSLLDKLWAHNLCKYAKPADWSSNSVSDWTSLRTSSSDSVSSSDLDLFLVSPPSSPLLSSEMSGKWSLWNGS